jgi:uncharacterized membrane protein YfcA
MLPFVLFGLGAGAGTLGVLLGGGGGALLVPALLFLGGLPFTAAAGTSLICVVATSVAGSAAQFRARVVDVPVALRLQTFAVSGAVIGGLVAPALPERVLHIGFAVVLLIAAWQTWPRGGPAPTAAAHSHSALAGFGAAAGGLVASVLGIGGGIVFTPVLHLLLRLDFHRSAATSIYLIGLTAGSAGLVYLFRGDVALPFVAPTMLGALVGATAASTVARRIAAAWLKRAFVLLLIYVAIRMVLRASAGA